MEHDFTRGNILKTIAVFALPYMLSYFLQMLYGMADLYMMGQFSGAAGITAVGNGAQTLYIITVTLVGLVEKMISFLFIVPSSMGATVSALTAQNAGAGKDARARQVLRCAMTISGVRLSDHGADVAGGTGVYWLFCQGPRGGRGRYRLYAQLYFRCNLCRHPHLP